MVLFIAALSADLLLTRRATDPTPASFPVPKQMRRLIFVMILFILLLFPYTHFTGIDTYKWQDLATAVGVEETIPWLVHPLSLLGFTPRSYPSAQPLLLSTIQLLTGGGIERGFFILSVWTMSAAFATAFLLGWAVFSDEKKAPSPRLAFSFALFYVLSPVFMRYTHWATGRGVFLAIVPLFLLALVKLPQWRACLSLTVLLPLLATTHKVGLFAPPLLLAATAFSGVLPRGSKRWTIMLLVTPFALAALAICPPAMAPAPIGSLPGVLRFSLTRFGWMVPLAIAGLVLPRDLWHQPVFRRLFPATLLSIPLAYETQMYGALVALPFITLTATHGIERMTRRHRSSLLLKAFVVLSLCGAVAVIVDRSSIATPPHVYDAAMFLETYDPEGPFMVHAPGRAQTQIQAYVSGCPRFSVSRNANVSAHRPTCPSLLGPPRDVLRNCISALRGILSSPGLTTDYYGTNPRHYYFIINEEGSFPPGSHPLYARNGVEISLHR